MFNLRAFGPRLVIPASFSDCLSYEQQVLWLLEHKSPILTAGENITLTENENGTITVSAEQEDTHTYSIKKITHLEPIVPSGQIVWYEYQLVNENDEQYGDSIRVDNPTYTITKTPYDGGYDYNLVKNGYLNRGETIRVPNAEELYVAGGVLEGDSNPSQGNSNLDQINVTVECITGDVLNPTIVNMSNVDGVCSIGWNERTQAPHRPMFFIGNNDMDYMFEGSGYSNSPIADTWQIIVTYEFDGVDVVPSLSTVKVLADVRVNGSIVMYYDDLKFITHTTDNKTTVSFRYQLPVATAVSSVSIRGLTFFN